jgi:glycosyltransferase involved in cell wall biosynthesis
MIIDNYEKDLLFVGPRKRTSGIVRAVQMASIFNCDFLDSFESADKTIFSKKCVIFVRFFNPGLVSILKSKGIKVGFDVNIPNIKTDKSISVDSFNDFDFYIANNTNHKNEIIKKLKKEARVFVIPHHHVNFNQDSPNVQKKTVESIGFIGLKSFLSDSISDIENFCNERNLNFICEHPDTREECISSLRKLDIAIACALNKNDINYQECIENKPNIKICNYQSFGIPTISTPHKSVAEFGDDSYIFINSVEELLESILKLSENFQLRKEMSRKSFENSRKYNISSIKKIYQDMIEIL